MEVWVKCLSPQNTFGDSGINSVAAKYNTIELNLKVKNKKGRNKHSSP